MLTLHNSVLLPCWDNQTHYKVDGQLVYHSAFSVLAFATQPTKDERKRFAQKVLRDIETPLLAHRKAIQHRHQQALKKWGDIRFTSFELASYELNFDPSKLHSASAMVLKLFLALDEYLTDAQRAMKSGELMQHQFKAIQTKEIFRLNALFQQVFQTTQTFHKIRKGEPI